MDKNFWKTKPLSDFSEEEWEAVCMRCGKCCLFKEQKNNKICFINLMCDGYDFETGKCSRYATRLGKFCTKVDLRLLKYERELLPETCAYRLLYEGKPLPAYHPLVSGNSNSVHEAKQTVMEIPDVRSITEVNNLLCKCNASMKKANCTLEERNELLKQIDEALNSSYVAVYDLPQ